VSLPAVSVPAARTPLPGGVSRRDLLRISAAATAGLAAGTVVAPGTAAAAASPVRWDGHQPGRIYLGASSRGALSTLEGTVGRLGLQRSYYRWDDARRESATIARDHAAGRLPWISFKPASDRPGGWSAIASGRDDADLRARARRYAGLRRPVVVTFHHEPQNDRTGSPAEFAAAWLRVHDVMRSETGLQNVVHVPVLGEWTFNPVNRGPGPEAFLTRAVLERCAFLGIDLYQNASGQGYDVRLGRVLDWLDARGHATTMVGLGETACTDDYGRPTGAQWWSDSWAWAVQHRDRVAAISYFHSLHHNDSGNDWLLTQSRSKLAAFRSSLRSPTSCRL